VGWETLGGIAVRKTAIKSRSPDFRQNRFGFCPKGTAFLRGKKAQLISRIFLKVLFLEFRSVCRQAESEDPAGLRDESLSHRRKF